MVKVVKGVPYKDYLRKWRAKRKRKLIKILGGKCVKCGKKSKLDIHHDKYRYPRGTGKNYHIRLDAESMEWYKKYCRLLCRKHHRRFHGQKWINRRRRKK